MPHQLAVRSGVIHPKYPAAPRQWVSYMGDQPGPGGAAMPPPSLGTGVQRDFSRRWGGDAESRFPRLDALGRAAALGAIGKVLSDGLAEPDKGDAAGPTAPTLPPPPSGVGGPSGVGTSSQQTSSASASYSSSPPSQQAGLGTGQRALNSGMPALGAGPSANLAVPQDDDDDANIIDAESWEVESVGPANMYRHPLADSFKEIGDKPNPFAGPMGRGPAKRGKSQGTPDLASPALRRQQNLVSEQRRKAPNNNALNNIKGAIARFEGYT
jgi:hypothetical protein